MQTARTTPKGSFELGGHFSLVSTAQMLESDSILNLKSVFPLWGASTGSIRYGITDRDDAGIKLGPSGLFTADYKHMLLGNQSSRFALSTGVGFLVDYGDSDPGFESHYYLPIYASVHLNDYFAIYNRTFYGFTYNHFGYNSSKNTFTDRVVMSNGICIGTKIKFMFEVTTNLSKDDHVVPNLLTAGIVYIISKPKE